MAELDLARSVLAKEEAEFMRSGDAVTDTERRAAEAERALEQTRDSQAEAREGLDGRREQIVTQREHAQVEREEAAKAVDATLLALYERIPAEDGAGRVPAAWRRVRPLLHRGADAATRADPARCDHRKL